MSDDFILLLQFNVMLFYLFHSTLYFIFVLLYQIIRLLIIFIFIFIFFFFFIFIFICIHCNCMSGWSIDSYKLSLFLHILLISDSCCLINHIATIITPLLVFNVLFSISLVIAYYVYLYIRLAMLFLIFIKV